MTWLIVSVDGPVHRWTLDRPERRNALGTELMVELLEAADRASGPDCRLVVLDATPPAFCAGSDLKQIAAMDSNEAIIAHERHWSLLSAAFRSLDAPVLAVIGGPAIGGGLFLAAFADHRIAAREAVFGAPEVPLGWLPPGGFEELIELVGVGRTRELVMTGRRIDGAEAHHIGLVNQAVSLVDLDAAAAEAERMFLELPPRAVADVKRYLRLRPGWTRAERDQAQLEAFTAALDSDEARETLRRSREPRGARAHG
jgi:enoyl-CoA hydratase/carnithine racemase